MSEQEYMTVMPSYKFRINNTAIEGYVTAESVEKAVEILRCIHLGPKEIIELEWEGKKSEVIKGAGFTISTQPTTQIPIQISDVKKEE